MLCRSVGFCKGAWDLVFDAADGAQLLSVGVLLMMGMLFVASKALGRRDEVVTHRSATYCRSRLP